MLLLAAVTWLPHEIPSAIYLYNAQGFVTYIINTAKLVGSRSLLSCQESTLHHSYIPSTVLHGK
jgi:hypothetical protein